MAFLSFRRSPRHQVRHVLSDGSRVVVRPLEPADADVVSGVFDRLGPVSRQRRFMVPKHTLTAADLRQLTAVDHCNHEAYAALSVGGRPIGVARFVHHRNDPDTAELAIEVADIWHERGIGSILVSTLVTRARELGVRRFSILMAPDNRAAVRLMRALPGEIGRVAIDGQSAEFVVVLHRDYCSDVRTAC
jgi:RimJ/RimL family protein N-acetyltransferase